jgi:hypothetical protein
LAPIFRHLDARTAIEDMSGMNGPRLATRQKITLSNIGGQFLLPPTAHFPL